MGTSIQADFPLTFGTLKTGFFLNEGFNTTGEVILCELSVPNKYKNPTAYLIDEGWVEASSPSPQTKKHKYDGGVLYIIAGSEGLTGAGILAAKSAWSTGLGAVVLITPKGLLEIYEKQLAQIIKKPVGGTNDVFFSETHLERVKEILNEKPGKLLIGPGLGRNPETIRFTHKLLQDYQGDTIIDADALFALSELEELTKPTSANWLLTPHPGELRTLTNKDVKFDHERLDVVKALTTEKNITILSKGMPGIVGTENGKFYITGYDTRAFTRAGFGDVLAGKVSAYWLISKSPDIACFKALLDGKDKANNYYSSHSDVLEPIDII
jgi:NAD(P)H-hydrate epimerase